MPKFLCALLAMLALTAAGCGGPSKDEYAADLDKVCKKSNERIQKVEAPKTIKEIGDYSRKARPILEDSIKEAGDLELPEEKGKQFKAYIEGSRKSLSELGDLEKAADAGNTAAVRRVFAKTTQENNMRDAQAKKLGLKECGSG